VSGLPSGTFAGSSPLRTGFLLEYVYLREWGVGPLLIQKRKKRVGTLSATCIKCSRINRHKYTVKQIYSQKTQTKKIGPLEKRSPRTFPQPYPLSFPNFKIWI